MNRKRIILLGAAVVAAAAIVIGGNFFGKYLQKKQWIDQQVYTQTMEDIRQRAYLNILKATPLIPDTIKLPEAILYNAYFYPEARTVICTVSVPPEMQEPAVYLITPDGTAIPGWYQTDLFQFGIRKIAFEELETDQFVSLDLVDKSAFLYTEYDPSDSSIPRVRFDLTLIQPPPLGSDSSEAAASSSAS